MERYLRCVSTLSLDVDRCVGCRMCLTVCPQAVWTMVERKAAITDLDGCIECGACAKNCAEEAISVRAGVGCAASVIASAFKRPADGCC